MTTHCNAFVPLCLAALAVAIAAPAHSATPTPSPTAASATARQELFPTPERAVEVLIAATRSGSLALLRRVLGPAGDKLIESGDPAADRGARSRFVAAYDSAHQIQLEGPDKAVLIVGAEEWPLPIPLVRERSGWRFDTQAGESEILDRRVGRNELSVIEVCRQYVQAQREYAAMLGAGQSGREPGRTAKPEYARRLLSRDGQHDGLYWPARLGHNESPLGPLLARATATGTGEVGSAVKLQPYHGYYFRILTRQGQHAPGGARSYIVDGRMTEGFGLLAYPATYGNSGIMTFVVDQDGIVYEKNLGPETERLARGIEEYDPDSTWRAP